MPKRKARSTGIYDPVLYSVLLVYYFENYQPFGQVCAENWKSPNLPKCVLYPTVAPNKLGKAFQERHMTYLSRLLTLFALSFAVVCTPALAEDVAGSQDHPILTRFPGSEIKWYDVQAFSPYHIATGPVTGYNALDDWTDTQGQLTRIYYEMEGTKTQTEVYANYKKALVDAGFTILADGVFTQSSRKPDVGSRKWLGTFYKRNALPPNGIRLLSGTSTSGGTGFIAATKKRAAGTVFVTLGISQYRDDIIATMIDVVEVDDVKTDLVSIDAEAIGRGILEYGRVVLDGLFFEHDKAALKNTSGPALVEITSFLNAHSDMNFYVVGHTDSTGTYTYNSTLSGRRAASVRKALVEDHGIAADRLEAHGVGPLNPVFSNSSEGGRAKNRRVELVER